MRAGSVLRFTVLSLATLAGAVVRLHGGDCVVRGRLSPAGAGTAVMQIEIADADSPQAAFRAMPDTSGQFRFDGVRPGEYELRVITRGGDVVYRTPVSVHQSTVELSIELGEARRPLPVAGSISAAALGHRPPSRAVKEFRTAEKRMAQQQLEAAIAGLERAIAIDPLYRDAYMNLTACYGGLRNYEKAAVYAGRAVELDPGSSAAQANLSRTLLYLRRDREAEAAARQAVRLDNQDSSHFLLALALKGQPDKTDEALEHFRRAAGSVPIARLHRADLLARIGHKGEAAGELRTYLSAPGAADTPALKAWLARLEQR